MKYIDLLIDQACGQNDWILAEFFLRFQGLRRSLGLKKKKGRGSYPVILTEQAWSREFMFSWLEH